jgi:hypothetical protein
MARGMIKPQKINLKREDGESKNDFKNRVADAERAEFRRVSEHNLKIAQQQRPTSGGDDRGETYTSHQNRGRGRHSIGHHD